MGGYMYLLFIELHHVNEEPAELKEVVVTGQQKCYTKLPERVNTTPGLVKRNHDDNKNVTPVPEARFSDASFLTPATEPSPPPESRDIIELPSVTRM